MAAVERRPDRLKQSFAHQFSLLRPSSVTVTERTERQERESSSLVEEATRGAHLVFLAPRARNANQTRRLGGTVDIGVRSAVKIASRSRRRVASPRVVYTALQNNVSDCRRPTTATAMTSTKTAADEYRA